MAKVKKSVKNLTALEKEIYRLRLEARNLEGRLDENFSYLKENFTGMAFNSVFQRNRSGSEMLKEKIAESIWSNQKLQDGLCRIIDHLVDKAADGVEQIVDKVFMQKEKNE